LSETFLDDKKSQKQLEDELGKGVEKEPELTPKPDLELPKVDLSGAFDVNAIIEELKKVPDIIEAEKQIDKHTDYLTLAKKIWTIRQAEHDSFKIKLKVGVKDQTTGKWKWTRKEGQQVYEEKTFYYSPISIQEKDEMFRLLVKRQDASNEVTLLGIKVRKIASDKNETGAEEFMKSADFDKIQNMFYKANQDYYVECFKIYFGPEEDDLARISFEDITDYSDVALRKEGVKSPQ
jgi:hypothetical protein